MVEEKFVDILISTLIKKYDYKVKLSNSINEVCEYIKEYFSELQTELKKVCEISNGEVNIKMDEANIIASMSVSKRKIYFKKEEVGVGVYSESIDIVSKKNIESRIDYIDCQGFQPKINSEQMDKFLKKAFSTIIEDMNQSL